MYSQSSKNNIKKLFYNVKEFSTSFLGIGMIFLTLIMIISTVYALEKSLAIKESFRFITYIALLFIIKYEIEEDSKIKNIIKCIVVITSILCIFGIVQYFTKIGLNPIFVSSEGTRITSTMENPNGFGAYLILSFFPIFMLSFDRINKKRRMVFIGISLLMVVNIFFTYSRNATVGFAIGIVILAILYNYKILGIFLVIIPVFFMDTSLIHRFSNMKISVLNDPRIKLWKVAIKMIKDHPIMGVGNGNYVALYDTYIAKYR